MTTITIEWEDGSAAMITEQEFIEACLETLQQLRKNQRKTGSPLHPPLHPEGYGKSGIGVTVPCPSCAGTGLFSCGCGLIRCDVCRGSGRALPICDASREDEQRAEACQPQGGEL